MTWRSILVSSIILVVLAVRAAAAATSPPPNPLTALLTTTDLPPGRWIEHALVTDHESLSRIAETTICGQPTPALTDDALDGAGVILRGGEFGPSIHHIVLVFGPAGAQQALLRLQELSVPCEWMWTDELGLRSLWQAEPLALPPAGDDTVAWRVRFETRLPSRGTITGEFAYAYFVRGDLLAMVAWLPTDDNRGLHFIETLARQADQKLAAATR